jgi:hypothetical protein
MGQEVRRERVTETDEAVAHAGLHRAERSAEEPSDLRIGVPVRIGELDDLALEVGQPVERVTDLLMLQTEFDLLRDHVE